MKEMYTNSFNKEIKDDALLKTEELAKVLNVSVKTVRRWHYIGALKGMKIGHHLVRYRWGDVVTWLNQQQQ